MSKLSPARAYALACLLEAARGGRFVREVAASALNPPAAERDRALGLRLALGATAAAGTLDELLDRYLDKPRAVKTRVRWALRIAAYEMVYLDVAPRVAVSQGVELVRSQARSAAGMANAVLRRVGEARESFLAADDIDAEAERFRVTRARRAGLPLWLVDAVAASVGEKGADALCAAQLESAPVAFHLNPRFRGFSGDATAGCGDRVEWHDIGPSADGRDERPAHTSSTDDILLADAAVLSDRFSSSPDSFRALPGLVVPNDAAAFIRSGALEHSDAVASDSAAQLIATVATAPGTCLEIGAGRGTKTFVMAAQARRRGWERTHVALDLHERKGKQNRARLEAAGLAEGISFVTGDGCNLDEALAGVGERMLFDRVFVDAPCSGTGTMRRHPEIPWRLDEDDVRADGSLPSLQLSMLREASRRVKPGGELIYATCSVLATENRQVVDAFLNTSEGATFHEVPVHEATAIKVIDAVHNNQALEDLVRTHENEDGTFQTAPALGSCDGHFCARLMKSSD